MLPDLSKFTQKPMVQICWSVPDVKAFALQLTALLGAGPWFYMENIPIEDVTYRDRDSTYDHTAALGQWGDIQIELHHQNCDTPSAVKDLLGDRDRLGILHVTYLADDVDEEIEHMASLGFPTVFTCSKGTDMYTAWFDTANALGTYLEIYGNNPTLNAAYAAVKHASIGWDGSDPIRGFDQLPMEVLPALNG